MNVQDRLAALAGATDWHKSSHSDVQNTGCVEVGTAGEIVGVRDTTLGRRSPVLAYTKTAWREFLRKIG